MDNTLHSLADQALLDASPNFLSIGDMFKATPRTEGNKRFIYMEASSEARDLQNEVVLQKALTDSAEYFLRVGNIDLDHYTQIGRPNPVKGWPGIPGYEAYEIGRPVDVRMDGKSTFVKAQISDGTGIAAEKANYFWSSITDIDPPKRWYPSVGGAVMERSVAIDKSTGAKYPVITKVRWANIGFSLTPVNPDLAEVSTIPIGVLAKSWGTFGLDLRKSLTAGYGSDSATLTGGSALRGGSTDRGLPDYFLDFRDQFAALIHAGTVGHDVKNMVKEAGTRFRLPAADAAEYVQRFLGDLKRSLKEKS